MLFGEKYAFTSKSSSPNELEKIIKGLKERTGLHKIGWEYYNNGDDNYTRGILVHRLVAPTFRGKFLYAVVPFKTKELLLNIIEQLPITINFHVLKTPLWAAVSEIDDYRNTLHIELELHSYKKGRCI